MKTFVNANRIESAISKYPDFEDQFRLKGYVIEDLFTDIRKESEEKAEKFKAMKKVTKPFDKLVYDTIVSYLQNVRT